MEMVKRKQIQLALFMDSSCISEEQFNLYINNTQDLLLLQTLLELKLYLISENKHSHINYPVQDILSKIETCNVDDVCLVLKFALQVQCNEAQYIELLWYIQKNLTETMNEACVMNNLKLLQVALSLCDFQKHKMAFIEFMLTSSFNKIVVKLLYCNSNTIINYTSILLPQLLKLEGIDSKSILCEIWENSLESKKLDILCVTADFFISEDTLNSYPLLYIEKFWYLLQKCICSDIADIQKKAMYLLKKAIYFVEKEDCLKTETKIVSWEENTKTEVITAWYNLLLLFETSREKQLHLIEPTYPLLPSLEVLHASWLICIYKILLNHAHNAVTGFAICTILKSKWYFDSESFLTMTKVILISINKIDFVANTEIWNECNKFIKKLNDNQYHILVKEGVNIMWIPVICYKYYKSLFSRKYKLSVNLLGKILTNIEKLPHKYIRNGCFNLIISLNKDLFSITLQEYSVINKFTQRHGLSINYVVDDWIYKAIEILTNLRTTKDIDHDLMQAILKITYNSNDLLIEHLIDLLLETTIPLEILDRIFVTLCSLQKCKTDVLVNYLVERLKNSKIENNAIKTAVPFLFSKGVTKDESQKLLQLSINILLDYNNINVIQKEIAFEILSQFENKVVDVTKIIENLKTDILDGNKTAVCLYLPFLRLYETQSEDTFRIYEIILETGNTDAIIEIFSLFKNCINACDNSAFLFDFINSSCLPKLKDIKKADDFKRTLTNLMESLFTNTKICNTEVAEQTLNVVHNLLQLTTFSDDTACILGSFILSLSEKSASTAQLFRDIILELILYGDALKKEHRAEYMVCQQIDIDCKHIIQKDNPNYRRLQIRIQAVMSLTNIVKHSNHTADEIVQLLKEKYNKHFNKRYFADSCIHLHKTRILQSLLMIHKYIQNKKEMIEWLANCLCCESHQASVKFYIQWLLIKLLNDNDECLNIITSKVDTTSKVHSSTIAGFMSILYHITLSKNEAFWIKTFQVLLPWTMGAHFNLRLYAQQCLKYLYENACKRSFMEVQKLFKSSIDSIECILEKTERSFDLIDKFVFNEFDPNGHFNINMIYYYIPKLTNVSYYEYENILNVIQDNFKEEQKVYNIEKFVRDSKVSTTVESPPNSQIIQRKVTPDNSTTKIKTSELVVVASLIDKMPNLGGLSRTCEVFGVKQLVLASKSNVKDREFQSLSMSSESWVDIEEVKVNCLPSFLFALKEKGYSIIGAEQTSDSTSLAKFKFPVKTVLLLGNEKEGIPPNLLHLVDFCVEIPQWGVIRSLNVHVAASTFIWEYNKQHVK